MKSSADQGPRWITSSQILLYYLFKIFSRYLKGENAELFVFLLAIKNTTSSPDFLGRRFNNLQRAALLTSFWSLQNSFQIWSTAAGYGEL